MATVEGTNRGLDRTWRYALLLLGAVIFIGPLLFMVMSSLKPDAQLLGDTSSLRAFLPRYLELSMENFAGNQEQIRRYIEGTLGRFFPMNQFEDMARQNMALFQRAASLLNPLSGAEDQRGQQAAAPGAGAHDTSAQIRELNERIEALQKQLGELIEVQQKR